MSLITRTYTFTDGTVAYGSQVNSEINNIVNTLNSLDSASSSWTNVKTGVLTVTGLSTLTGGIVGVSTNSSATAGNVGEYVSSVASGVGQGSTGTYANITSISLTAGDWDVTGQPSYQANSGTGLGQFFGAVSAYSGSATTDHVLYDNVVEGVPSSSYNVTLTIAQWRVSLSATTTIYLKAALVWGSGTSTIAGRISARRVR